MKWTGLFLVICTLYLETQQHYTDNHIRKPTSVNGCYSGHEGTFFWTILDSGNEPTLTLNITTEMSEEEWVGIGFSDDRLMGRDDVVAVLKDPFRETFLAVSLLNPIHYKTTVLQDNDSIIKSSVSYEDGLVRANITKSIELSFPSDTLHKSPVFLMFCKGFRRKKTEKDSDIKPIHAHNQNPTVSRYAVPLFKNIPNCIPSQTNKLLKLHGVLMVLVWLNLVPFSVFIARYAKYYFTRQSLWFTIHKYAGILSGLLVLGSVISAYVALKTLHLERHQTVGVAVLILTVVHLVLAILRPSHETRFRRLWEIVHKITAGVITIGSIANVVDGLSMLQANVSCYWVISLQIAVFCLLFLLLENPQQVNRLMTRVCGCLRISPNVYYTLNTQYKPSEDSESDCDDITMVTMNLDNTGTRSNYTMVGLWVTVVTNVVVTAVVIAALAET